MAFRDTQNPGIGGLDEITDAESLFLQNLTNLSYAQGDILYHNGSDLVRLAKGTGGQQLKMNAGATAPEWAAAAGGGDLLADGTVPLTANWDVGAFTITGTQFISDIAIGTAPFVVTSTTPVTNLSIGGNAATVTNATLTTALTVDTGTLTLTAHADNDSVLTIGKGAVSVSGTNTGDNTVCTSGDATTAETLKTTRAIYGNNFDGSAALTQIIASTYGGTGNGFSKFTGATTAEKTYTLPDANATLLYSGGALGTPSGGTLTNATGLPAAGVVNTAATLTDTQTLTNKRVTPRVSTEASDAEPTINTDNVDAHSITAIGEEITSMTTNLTGTPTNFDKLLIRFLDDGTGRVITWGASFQAMGVDLPTTTTASKVLTVGFIYDTADSKWGCVASVEEA